MDVFTKEDREPLVCTRVWGLHAASGLDRAEELMVTSTIASENNDTPPVVLTGAPKPIGLCLADGRGQSIAWTKEIHSCRFPIVVRKDCRVRSFSKRKSIEHLCGNPFMTWLHRVMNGYSATYFFLSRLGEPFVESNLPKSGVVFGNECLVVQLDAVVLCLRVSDNFSRILA